MKLFLPRSIAVLILFLVLATAFASWAFVSTRQIPDFYRDLLAVPLERSEVAGIGFERQLVELSNRIRLDDSWTAKLTQDQVNGWLASDLPEKFPNALPSTIKDPRISIEEKKLKLVFQLESREFSGVIQINGEVFSTEVRNQIAFRIHRVQSGFVPVPISWWAPRLENSLGKSEIVLTWSEWEDDIVALVTLPASFTHRTEMSAILEDVQLGDGCILLAGRTVHQAKGSSQEVADTTANVQR